MTDSARSFIWGRLGNYRVLRLIGRGATSRVYLAEHLFLRRLTALKVLTCDFARWPDADLEIFEETAISAARLHHPNIVTLYDIDEIRARPYLTMEFVDGPSLHALLRRKGPLPTSRCLSILWDVALALDCAHGHDVVHCDIKPGNILITPGGRAKVTDFGLSQALNRAVRSALDGMVAGTPEYISPEQVLAERPDRRSDLYALGVTLYEMLTGESPFRGGSDSMVFRRHLDESRSGLLHRLPPNLGRLGDVLRRLMSRYPRDRYPNVRELLADLRPPRAAGLRKAPPRSPDLQSALQRLGRLRREMGPRIPRPGEGKK